MAQPLLRTLLRVQAVSETSFSPSTGPVGDGARLYQCEDGKAIPHGGGCHTEEFMSLFVIFEWFYLVVPPVKSLQCGRFCEGLYLSDLLPHGVIMQIS